MTPRSRFGRLFLLALASVLCLSPQVGRASGKGRFRDGTGGNAQGDSQKVRTEGEFWRRRLSFSLFSLLSLSPSFKHQSHIANETVSWVQKEIVVFRSLDCDCLALTGDTQWENLLREEVICLAERRDSPNRSRACLRCGVLSCVLLTFVGKKGEREGLGACLFVVLPDG